MSDEKIQVVSLSGAISGNVSTTFEVLAKKLSSAKVVVFVLEKIDYLDSLGIRSWINFIRGFCEGRQVIYDRCSANFIAQISMVPNLLGKAEVRGFYGLYFCDCCDEDRAIYYQAEDGYERIFAAHSEAVCEVCKSPLEPEMEAVAFFSFLEPLEKGSVG